MQRCRRGLGCNVQRCSRGLGCNVQRCRRATPASAAPVSVAHAVASTDSVEYPCRVPREYPVSTRVEYPSSARRTRMVCLRAAARSVCFRRGCFVLCCFVLFCFNLYGCLFRRSAHPFGSGGSVGSVRELCVCAALSETVPPPPLLERVRAKELAAKQYRPLISNYPHP